MICYLFFYLHNKNVSKIMLKEKIVLDRPDFKFKLEEKSLVALITFSSPPSSCNYGDFVLWVSRRYKPTTKIQVVSHWCQPLEKNVIDASPFSFSFSFNKKKLNLFFLPDSMLYEDTIPNCPFQRTAYLVIYRISSSYLLGWMEVFDPVL